MAMLFGVKMLRIPVTFSLLGARDEAQRHGTSTYGPVDVRNRSDPYAEIRVTPEIVASRSTYFFRFEAVLYAGKCLM